MLALPAVPLTGVVLRRTVARMRRVHTHPVRITTASRPHSEDIHGREVRYLVSMGIRTACFILGVVFMGHWVMWVFLVGAVFLPYVAVILANAGARTDPEPDLAFERDLRALGGSTGGRLEPPDDSDDSAQERPGQERPGQERPDGR